MCTVEATGALIFFIYRVMVPEAKPRAFVPRTARARFRGISTGYINACYYYYYYCNAPYTGRTGGASVVTTMIVVGRCTLGIMRVTVFGSESAYARPPRVYKYDDVICI